MLLTARPERVHELTEAWLRRYRIRWDLLLMRPWGDYEMARDFKQASVWDLRDYGFELRLAIEDDRRNVSHVPRRGRPLPLPPQRLLRLSPPTAEVASQIRPRDVRTTQVRGWGGNAGAVAGVSPVSGPFRAQ